MECRKPYAKAGKWASRFLVIMLSVMLIVTMMPTNWIGKVYAEPETNADTKGSPAFSQQADEDGNPEPEGDVQDAPAADDVDNADAVAEKGAQDNDADADNAAQDSDAVNGAKNGTRGVPDDPIQVSSWDELYNACVNAPDNVSTSIRLSDHIIRTTNTNKRIEINKKKVIILDLNGKTLDARIKGDSGKYNHVLDVHGGGNLTVEDSSGNNSGIIKGGFTDNGGGIYISENGTCRIKGGTIGSNDAHEKGGAIYTKGTLIMTGGVIGGNYLYNRALSDDEVGRGGGIFCDKTGTIQLKNVLIDCNEADEYGSGIMIVLGNDDSYIENCTIKRNGRNWTSSKGGGIYVDADIAGRTLKITDTDIINNSGYLNGGGIYLKKGTIEMTRGNISNNGIPTGSGGGVYVDTDSASFIAESVAIDKNYINSGGKGGGICQNKGLVYLKNCTVKNNTAGDNGGGIYATKNTGRLNLAGTQVTGNKATNGGGIYLEDIGKATDAMRIGGKTVISNNSGSDLFLPGSMLISISGNNPLENGANIGVTHPKGPGVFTMDFESYMGESATPDTYFFSNDGYMVTKKDREGYLAVDVDEAGKFLKIGERIASNVNGLGPANWMSGISGERYLYEINTPHTHDSAMWKSTAPWDSSVGAFLGYHEYAHTQYVSIKQQLEDGVRVLDLRLNPVYWGRDNAISSCEEKDDGKNLWLCHGKNSGGGVYYTEDEDGKRLSLQKVLDWTEEFLKNHPTESVIMIFDAEITDDNAKRGYRDTTFYRIGEHLKKLAKKTNPSTGKSYIYTEPGKTYRAKYTHWPQMKDCRGQIVLKVCEQEDFKYVGGFVDYLLAPVTAIAPEKGGGNCVLASEKIQNLKPYFRQCEQVRLPVNANSHLTTFHHADSNSKANSVSDFIADAGRTLDGKTTKKPLAIAKEVHENVFQEERYFEGDAIGNYYGFFKMDGAERVENTAIWRTNFPDDLEYCTITVKSGLPSSDAPADQQYRVLLGSTITIPGCIYEGADEDKFVCWKASTDSQIYVKDNKYKVEEDVVFTAQWSDQIQTPVTVVWKDADNLDSSRPKELLIRYNNEPTATIKADDNWIVMLPGEITEAPEVENVPEGYTSEVKGSQGKDGYTITMTYTPGGTISASAKISWQDEENVDGIRPGSVTLHLNCNGQEKELATVTASDGWTHNFGDQPKYVDGEEAEYTITEDDINGYSIVTWRDESNEDSIYGSSIINTHTPDTVTYKGYVTWDDNENAEGTRPDSVTVQLLADGTKVASGEATETVWGEDDHTGVWEWSLTVYKAKIKNAKEITVKGGDVSRYSMEVKQSDTITQDIVNEDGEIETKTMQVDPPCYEIIYKLNKKTYSLTLYEDTAGTKVWKELTLNEGASLKKYAGYGAEEPNILAKEGYTFGGWATQSGIVVDSYRDKDGNLNPALEGKLFNWNTTITKDTKAYPIWIRDRLRVVIEPGADDAVIDDAQEFRFTVNIDEKIAMRYLVNAVRPGYELDGWYTNGGVLWNGKNWKSLNYVTEGWVETAGWGVTPEYCDKDENGEPIIKTNADRKFKYYTVTLTAHWKAKTAEIVYDLGDHAAAGAALPAKAGVTFGTTVALAAVPDADTDYIFTGWKAPDGTIYSAGATFRFDDWAALDDPDAEQPSLTMTAQYVEKARVKLIFDANGGTAVEPVTEHEGNSVDLDDSRFSTTRTGYDFDGWYNSENEKRQGEYTFTANETLTAHWKVKQYTITIDSAGGNDIDPITQDYDTAIIPPEDPTKEHYTFAGWVPALPEKMPAENITVKAIWDPMSYKITFDTDGGNEIADIEDIYGAPVTAPEDPTKNGSIFEGWMDENSVLVDLPTYMPDTNPTYKAKWHQHKLTRTAAASATCTKDGNSAYWTCDQGDAACGKYFSDADATTEIKKDSWIIKAIGHKWGEWKVTKKPTATTDGEKQRVCKNDSSHVEKQKVPATGVSGTLFAKMTTKGKSNLTISWSKVDGAAGYDIFFAKCNKGSKIFTCKNIKTIKGNNVLSWTKKGLKKKTAYKAYVKAYVMKDGKKTYVKTSPMIHAYTSGGTKKCTNAKKVTVKKAAVSLKAGKTYKIKASVKKLKKNKKLMPKGHAPKLRYMSSNTKIATVNSSGKIKAKAKGKCYIYVYAHNGVSKKVKVTVK